MPPRPLGPGDGRSPSANREFKLDGCGNLISTEMFLGQRYAALQNFSLCHRRAPDQDSTGQAISIAQQPMSEMSLSLLSVVTPKNTHDLV